MQGLVAKCLHLNQVSSPLVDNIVDQKEVPATCHRLVYELVEPHLGSFVQKVKLGIVDQVSVIVRVEYAPVVFVDDPKDEVNLRVGQVALLLVHIRPKVVLQAELKVLEQIAALEELVAPVGWWLELRLVENDQQTGYAQQEEQNKKEQAEFDQNFGQQLRDEPKVEQSQMVHHVLELELHRASESCTHL